jgi:hypothetical protein
MATVKVKAEFTPRLRDGLGETETREVTLTLDERGWVHMKGGPTGYESFEYADGLKYGIVENGWMACGGTPGSWAQCFVPADEMAVAMFELVR